MAGEVEVHVERNIMVAMRDGLRLATDLYRPAVGGAPIAGKLPAILERTPYGKGEKSRSEIHVGMKESMSRPDVAAYFARHGYAVAYQDCRGRYESEGEFTKYVAEGEDGYDTVAWLAAQPWCSGKIGTMGLSYAAHTQAALACLNPPGLAAMVIDSGGFSNAYQAGIRCGGAFEMKQATWAFNQAKAGREAAADPLVRAALEAEDLHAWFRRMPWRPGHSPVRWVPDYESYLFEQWTRGAFDEYWRQLGIYTEGWYDRFADVPMVHLSSWYDAYVRTATENYLGLSRKKRAPVHLVMGPWTHGNRNTTHSGDVDFGPAATVDGNLAENWLEFRRRWFDRWLKGVANGVERDAKVRLFLMGGGSGRRNEAGRLQHGGRWIEADDWPLPETEFAPFHLHGDGGLRREAPAAEAAPLRFDYDPGNPVPTIGGPLTSGEPIFSGGAFDQREDARFFGCRENGMPLASRADVLVFETPKLTADVAIVGPITVRLWVASNCPDTDFTAKLIDVYPPNEDYPRGFAMNLTDGILRCRYRKSWERPEPMIPGEVAEITIEPFATCNLFGAGHRIRLDISSSNFPRFDVNPNTYEPEGVWRHRQIATNTVFVDRARPSQIVLPIVRL
jgi:putative CocE/NonD family hydrolase